MISAEQNDSESEEINAVGESQAQSTFITQIFFVDYFLQLGITITISQEKEPLGTGK